MAPEVIRKAFKLAESEKPGACHVEVPEDVAREDTDGNPLSTERARRPSPDRMALAAAARLIEAATFPLIFAGNGVIRGRAANELRQLARHHGIPVVHTFMAKGSMPADDPLCLLSAGLQARDYVACGFDKADPIVAVGYDPVEYAPKFCNPDRKKRIVHIDLPREPEAGGAPRAARLPALRMVRPRSVRRPSPGLWRTCYAYYVARVSRLGLWARVAGAPSPCAHG